MNVRYPCGVRPAVIKVSQVTGSVRKGLLTRNNTRPDESILSTPLRLILGSGIRPAGTCGDRSWTTGKQLQVIAMH